MSLVAVIHLAERLLNNSSQQQQDNSPVGNSEKTATNPSSNAKAEVLFTASDVSEVKPYKFPRSPCKSKR